jgi:hypothetical protein
LCGKPCRRARGRGRPGAAGWATRKQGSKPRRSARAEPP